MDRFKNILAVLTPGHLDPTSLRRTGELAAANHAELALIAVVEALPAWRKLVQVEGRTVDIEAVLLRDRTEELRGMAELAGITDAGIVVEVGKPVLEAIRHVLRDGVDLLVVGEPAPAPGGPAGLSAGVMQLLRKCPVPVWVMRPTESPDLRILALVDPDPTDPVRDGLNDMVLELATSMASERGSELHVAHAWELAGDATLASSPFLALPADQLGVLRSEVVAAHRANLAALLARRGIDVDDERVHLVKGDPGTVLPELAARLATSVIVIGTVARSGLSGLLMGNTAETILRSTDCSVLAVKPAGFETPVRLDRRDEG